MTEVEILVIGAGPAGIAAAVTAAAKGKEVLLCDLEPAPGGQIWRGAGPDHPQAGPWLARLARSTVDYRPGWRCVGALDGGYLFEFPGGGELVRPQKAILCLGARELLLPFPGWDLPGVTGAGALQALAKRGLDVRGRRIVLAGSGPLLLAAAETLKAKGARVLCLLEQQTTWSLLRAGLALLRDPGRLWQSLKLLKTLGPGLIRPDSWVLEARGKGRLSSVLVRQGGRPRALACDYLGVGFGLVANLELPELLGCAIDKGAVLVDHNQASSVPDLYCAGETTGIGGCELALLEGRIAALAACGRPSVALQRARDRAGKRAGRLLSAFGLRDEIRSLPRLETPVCRCEGSSWGEIQLSESARQARLQCRAGMGECQGRICGPALQFLKGWPASAARRQPLAPCKVATLLSVKHTKEST
ncbi:FAD-dependent oxidoreductase [Gallaecimonas sp. GXIMD4217]|uniref:FAD-dependent oxidoreductase n=1 Tax=Gallaecimonas sp. GXIMD4217 TaxID=3131927 RepID=UPI00311B0E2F